MAHINLITQKIYGTKENSPIWWHEKGHLKFNSSNFGNQFNFWKDQIFIWIVLIIPFSIFFKSIFLNTLSLTLVLGFCFMYFFEETWCWNYSIRNKDKWINKKRRKNNEK